MVLTGSCPWLEPWFRSYGAHLHLQAREDPIPTAMAVRPPFIPGGNIMRTSVCYAVAFGWSPPVRALNPKFEDVFGGGYDCTVSLRSAGAEFAGDCYYFDHGRDESRSFTGVRQK
jgi:hypothetical protein